MTDQELWDWVRAPKALAYSQGVWQQTSDPDAMTRLMEPAWPAPPYHLDGMLWVDRYMIVCISDHVRFSCQGARSPSSNLHNRVWDLLSETTPHTPTRLYSTNAKTQHARLERANTPHITCASIFDVDLQPLLLADHNLWMYHDLRGVVFYTHHHRLVWATSF